MSRKAQSHELTYDLIKRAVHGEPAAIEEYLLHYDAYINSLVEYETTGLDGRVYRHIDEDMKVQVQMKLVDALQKKWRKLIDMLAEMALPEPWRFKNPIYLTKNPDTPILERYIHAIFKKQLIDYTSEQALYRLLRLFSKVRARSRRCSSAPNRTRCAGLRFGIL